MEKFFTAQNPPEIAEVLDEIVRIVQPATVYLYNCKRSVSGQTTSFKLCIVADCEKAQAERDIYREVDCEVPFDVILYTQEEWRRLAGHPDSFARRILTTGTVVYG